MVERVRRGLAVLFLVSALIAAVLVPVRGITPVPGLLFRTRCRVAGAAKPEPGAQDRRTQERTWNREGDRAA